MKNAVVYARYSSDKQTEQSIEGQIRVCNEYAERNGLTILDTYIDRATTGTNDNRPAFQKMLSDSDKPVIWDIVLVYALDRFGRNAIEVAVNKQRLRKNKKTLISATQRTSDNIDGTRNLDGILLENVYIGLAEYFSAELSQKVSRGLKENRSKGLYTGGPIPFGYGVNNKKPYIDDDQAAIVREIFSMYANCHSLDDILDMLNERCILNKGKAFTKNMLYFMLRNRKYIGRYEVNEEVYLDVYPAIVPTDLFERVRVRIEHNKYGQKSKGTVFLLKDKIYCGYCGKRINGESGTSCTGKVMYYYKCSNRKKNKNNCNKCVVAKDCLEQIVLDMTMEIFTSKVNLDIICNEIIRVHEKNMTEQSVLNLLQDEKAKTEKSLKNILFAIEEGIINTTTKDRMHELEERLDELNAKILAEEYKLQIGINRTEVMEYLTHSVRDLFPQVLIDVLVNKIILYDDKIEVWFNYSERNKNGSPDNDSRDFILQEIYKIHITCRVIIASKKLTTK